MRLSRRGAGQAAYVRRCHERQGACRRVDLLLLQDGRHDRPGQPAQRGDRRRRVRRAQGLGRQLLRQHRQRDHQPHDEPAPALARAVRHDRPRAPVPARARTPEPLVPDRTRERALPRARQLHQGVQLLQAALLVRSRAHRQRVRGLRHPDDQLPRPFALRLLRGLHRGSSRQGRRMRVHARRLRDERDLRPRQQDRVRRAQGPGAALCGIAPVERPVPLFRVAQHDVRDSGLRQGARQPLVRHREVEARQEGLRGGYRNRDAQRTVPARHRGRQDHGQEQPAARRTTDGLLDSRHRRLDRGGRGVRLSRDAHALCQRLERDGR